MNLFICINQFPKGYILCEYLYTHHSLAYKCVCLLCIRNEKYVCRHPKLVCSYLFCDNTLLKTTEGKEQ